MQCGVVHSVEDGQQNEASGTDEGKHHRQTKEDLFAYGRVGDQTPAVSQPALGGKREVEGHGHDHGPGDEERLQLLRPNVADVRNVLALVHGRVVDAVRVDDPVEEQSEEHPEPHETREDRDHLRG